jgi:hypothetical protein
MFKNVKKLDEMQVRVVVLDKDDNNPRFLESNLTLGVRVNAPIYTELAKVTSLVVIFERNEI